VSKNESNSEHVRQIRIAKEGTRMPDERLRENKEGDEE
jgi:hypothetical protein